MMRYMVSKLHILPILLTIHPSTSSEHSPGCSTPLPDKPHPGRHHKFSLMVEDPHLGEVEREYNLHLPAHYDTSNTVPVPLVLDYHGWTGTAHDQMVNMPWRDVADLDKTGFIYISLQGMNDVPDGGFYGSWNVSRYSELRIQ